MKAYLLREQTLARVSRFSSGFEEVTQTYAALSDLHADTLDPAIAALIARVEGTRDVDLLTTLRALGDEDRGQLARFMAERAILLQVSERAERADLVRVANAQPRNMSPTGSRLSTRSKDPIDRLAKPAIPSELFGAVLPESPEAMVAEAANRGLTPEELSEAISKAMVREVWTHHPTEVDHPDSMDLQRRMGELILDARKGKLDAPDLKIQLGALMEELRAVPDLARHKPMTPLDEIEDHLPMMAGPALDGAIKYLKRLDRAVTEHPNYGAQVAKVIGQRAIISFGTWVAGDADGDFNKSPEVVARVAQRSSEVMLDRLRQQLQAVAEQLQGEGNQNVLKRIEAGLSAFEVFRHRQLAWLHGVQKTLEAPPMELPPYSPEAMLNDLAELVPPEGIEAQDDLESLRWAVRVGGFRLFTHDTRRHSRDITAACAALLGMEVPTDPEQQSAFREQLTAALGAALDAGVEPVSDAELAESVPTANQNAMKADQHTEPNRSLAMLTAFRRVQAVFGDDALWNFNISEAEDAADLLGALYLMRKVGIGDAHGVKTHVTPLCEKGTTVRDLPRTLRRGLDNDSFARQVLYTGGMSALFDPSDLTARTGGFHAPFALLRAQDLGHQVVAEFNEDKARISRLTQHAPGAFNTEVRFHAFHGVGGALSRNGRVPLSSKLAEQPPGSVGHSVQHTMQGVFLAHPKTTFWPGIPRSNRKSNCEAPSPRPLPSFS